MSKRFRHCGGRAMKTKDDEYVRVKQASAMLGLSPNTVRKWALWARSPSSGTRSIHNGFTDGVTWKV